MADALTAIELRETCFEPAPAPTRFEVLEFHEFDRQRFSQMLSESNVPFAGPSTRTGWMVCSQRVLYPINSATLSN